MRPTSGAVFLCLLAACARNGDTAAIPDTPENPPKAVIESVALAPATGSPVEKPEEPNFEGDPEQLIGLAPNAVSARLGPPSFVRRDGSSEIWQYPAKACILDVFLYREGETFKVDYVELRGRGAATLSRRDCFIEMIRKQLKSKSR
tara:strand:+ start:40 stop:480 length:441 start_codon:yes stop_codon:yes gene_type:complete